MTKEQFIDQYLDKYEQEHPDEKINYDELREQADCEWYDRQVDHGEATEYDLSAEQEAVSKEFRKGKAVDAYGKERKRERKVNPDKRLLVQAMADCFGADSSPCEAVEIVNPERQVDFVLNGVHYSATLTAHRPKKA